MPGWTWEYVEDTLTADRLDALFNKERKQTQHMTFDEFRAQFPNGIKV